MSTRAAAGLALFLAGSAHAAELYVQLGHSGEVGPVLFYGPDRLISAAADGTARVWDVKTGLEIRNFRVDAIDVSCMKLAPDGHTLLLAAFAADVVHLYDLRTESAPVILRGHAERVTDAVFFPAGGQLATSSLDGTVRLWRQASGELLKTFNLGGSAWSLTPGADGKSLIVGLDDNQAVIDLSDGHVRSTTPKDPNPDFSVWSADRKLASLYRDGGIAILDARGKERARIPVDSTHGRAFRPGSHQLAIASDWEIQLWDADKPRLLQTFRGHFNRSSEGTLAADDWFFSSAATGVRLPNPASRRPARKVITAEGFTQSPDQKLVAVRDGKTLSVVVKETLTPLRSWPLAGEVEVAFSPDGKLLARGREFNSRGDMADVVNIETGAVVQSFAIGNHDHSIHELLFSPDGTLLATVQPRELPKPDFTRKDSVATLWRVSDGAKVLEVAGRTIRFSPDGKRILYAPVEDGREQGVELRELSGEVVARLALPTLLAVSPDFRLLAAMEWKGWDGPRDLQIFELPSGQQVGKLSLTLASSPSVEFSNDGRRLAIGGDSGIQFWDVANQRLLGQFYALERADWVIASPDGRFEGTEGALKALAWKAGGRLIPLDRFFERFYAPGLLTQVLTGQLDAPRPKAELAAAVSPVPLVRIVTPAAGARLAQEEVDVELEATDQGGGVQDLRLYLNGKLVEGDARGLRRKDAGARKEARKLTIALLAGENRLRAIACNDQRTDSEPAELTVFRAAPEPQSVLHLIVVGIDRYENPKYQLTYAATDARAFHAAVLASAKGIFRKISAQLLLDGEARRADIERALARVQAEARPEDAVVFYYAGHGVMSEGTPQQPSRFYLVPPEVLHLYGDDGGLAERGLSVEQLQKWSAQVKAQKQLLALDACQSGGAVEQFAMRGAAEEKAILQLARAAGVVVLAATGAEQFATEFKELGHGVFTWALLKGLEGEADAGKPPDGKITVKELEAYLNDKVPELTRKYRGTAQYPNSFARGQDFPLGVAGAR